MHRAYADWILAAESSRGRSAPVMTVPYRDRTAWRPPDPITVGYLVFDLPDGRNVLVAVTTVDPERFGDVIGPAMEIVSKLDCAVGS